MKNLLLIFIILLSSGCATVMCDNHQAVTLVSNVEKVNVKIHNKKGENIFVGQTPVTAVLRTANTGYFNREHYSLIASKEGYYDHTLTIDSHISLWYYIGNLVFGGLIGLLLIDPISGDMFYLEEPSVINMVLENT